MSLLKHTRRDKMPHIRYNNNKDSRWDRIRKKYSGKSFGAPSLKSDAVRRLIETDFIGKKQKKLLDGDQDARTTLNPQLVMDMRHKLFREYSKSLPLATVGNQQNLDRCVAHNIEVEQRYFNNKLNKFRIQLEKQRKRSQLKLNKVNDVLKIDTPSLENNPVMASVATARDMKDFYAAPLEALQASNKLCTRTDTYKEDGSDKENTRETDEVELQCQEEHSEEQVPCGSTTEDTEDMELRCVSFGSDVEILKYHKDDGCDKENTRQTDEVELECQEEHSEEQVSCGSTTEERGDMELRCVRFGSDVKILKYQRETSNCSNSSDGLNSVVSDLAEETLVELRQEEEEKSLQTETKGDIADIEQKEVSNQEGEMVSFESNETLRKPPVGELSTNNFLKISQLKVPVKSPEAVLEGNEVQLSATESTAQLNHEQNLIIEELFEAQAHSNAAIMHKYFLKWIHYTNMERIEKQNLTKKHDRIIQINEFLDNIRKEKKRLNNSDNKSIDQDNGEANKDPKAAVNKVHLTKRYLNKIKVQQDIIDMQRLKLERQERMIMELKLNKVTLDAKEAREEIKKELKSFIRSGDPKTKVKAKCLQLIGNLKDADDDKFTRLQGHALFIPKFLQNMQERALVRSIKHDQARQRRQQHEAEREAQKLAAQEAKLLEDEEAKRLRIEALKEKRQQEKMQKVIKERERQRAIENNLKSEEYCRRRLLHRVGMEGFRRLLQLKYDNLRRCETLLRCIIQKNCFRTWHNYCVLLSEQKSMMADELYNKILKRQMINSWKLYARNERSKMYVAIDWHEFKSNEHIFLRWFGYSKRQKMIEDAKLNKAALDHEWNLKWKVLERWRRLPQILQLERETEERRQQWRMKIWEVLPDYTPNRDEF